MKKILLIIFLVIVLAVAGIYLVLKNNVFSLNIPGMEQIDLGIDESPDIIYAYYEEIGFQNNLEGDTPRSGTLVFEGGIDIEHTFTQKEINSWFSAWENSWTGIPFKNLQIKLNTDGTVEASSLITLKEAEALGRTLGYSQEDIEKAKGYIRYIPDPLPLYATGTASITENDVSIDIDNMKIGNISVPSNISSAIGYVIEDSIEKARTLSDYTNVKEAIVTSEGVRFKGTVPASVNVR